MATVYVFDTNRFRVLGHYHPQRFPSFWAQFDQATDRGLILSTREVFTEFEYQADAWLLDWIKARRRLFPAPTAEEQAFEFSSVMHSGSLGSLSPTRSLSRLLGSALAA